MQDLKGQTALVTGGASGIGLGIVEAFLEQGMNVMIADIREDHLSEVREMFVDRKNVDFMHLDVTDRTAMLAAAETLESRFGELHVLCNNAGVGPMTTAQNCSYDDWDWCLNVNLNGVFNGIHTFLPLIQKHGERGHIVNTASISAAMPMGLAYAASKCGVLGITEGIAEELAELNIGSTCLMPGPVRSNIHEIAKLRPAKYSDTRQGGFEAEMANRETPEHWLEPIIVGRMVVDAIQRNLLYVFTHNEFREGIEQRCKAMIAAIPKGSATEQAKQAVGFPVYNPVHSDLVDIEPASAENISLPDQ